MKKIKLNIYHLFPKFIQNLPFGDKIAHAILILPMYITLTFLLDFKSIDEFIGHRVLSLFISMLIGATIEIVDNNTPGNSASTWDMLWTWFAVFLLWLLQDKCELLIFF